MLQRQLTRLLGPLAICFLLSGCSREEVLSNLDQRESLEAIVALNRAGIDAWRESSGQSAQARYDVMVNSSDVESAHEALHEFGFPHERSESFDELTDQRGFIPNPLEVTKLRVARARASEIEKLLEALPGVVNVRVSFSAPDNDGVSSGELTRASVVIRYLSAAGKTPFSMDEVKQLVVGSIPGLSVEQVLVTASRVVLPGKAPSLGLEANPEGKVVALAKFAPFSFQVPEMQKSVAQRQIAVAVGVIMLVVGLLCGVVGYQVRKAARPKVKSTRTQGDRFFIESNANGETGRLVPSAGPPKNPPPQQ